MTRLHIASPWVHPTVGAVNITKKDHTGAVDVLFLSPWIVENSVSPTFQVIREGLSFSSKIVTSRVLERFLSEAEIGDYTDVIRYAKRYPVSLGMLSIATYLKSNGFSVAYRQLEAEREKAKDSTDWLQRTVAATVEQCRPAIIGIGGVTSEIPRLRELSRLLRILVPEALIVCGGPHVTFRPEDMLADGLADIVVHGEGEGPMLEIVRRHKAGCSLAGIAGTSLPVDGQIKRSLGQSRVDLSRLPQPDYSLLSEEMKRNGIIYAMYTRACPYKCNYCSEGQLFGAKLNNYSAVEFVDTLECIAEELGWKFIHIADSTFGLPLRALHALLDELERRSKHFLFSVNVRPDMYRYIDRATIQRMRRLGFIEFLIGSESGSDAILSSMQRGHTTADLVRTLKFLKENEIPFVSTYWMVGLPFETLDTAIETVRFVKRLLEDDLVFYASAKPFIPLPGTPIFDKPREFGISIDSLDWNLYERYSLPLPHRHSNLTVQEIESVTLLFQSVQAAVFERRAGARLYNDVESLSQRIEKGYDKAVYL